MSPLLIGTCGFPASMRKVFSLVDVVELQSSFYEPLSERQITTILKTNTYGKEITMKAWQVITHPHTSPSWKKMKVKPDGILENYGYLKPSEENFDALKVVAEQAKKLKASVIVFQTPPSMPYNQGHMVNIKTFFEKAKELIKDYSIIAWEPRGAYAEDRNFLSSIQKMEILIVVDALRRDFIDVTNSIYYTRLHGIGGKEVNYKYKYNKEDFERLFNKIHPMLEENKKVYVLFNNVYMLQDSIGFKEYVRDKVGGMSTA